MDLTLLLDYRLFGAANKSAKIFEDFERFKRVAMDTIKIVNLIPRIIT